METEFTPIQSVIGGGLIGVAAVMFFAFNGRIAGISGIISSLLPPAERTNKWLEGLCLIGGLVLSMPIYMALTGSSPQFNVSNNTVLIAVAGLVVGIGTYLGSGCTSGHGVCGISRLSPRSIVAVATFMIAGIVTVYVLRHVM